MCVCVCVCVCVWRGGAVSGEVSKLVEPTEKVEITERHIS